MSNKRPKINIASYRVFKTFNCLFEDDLSMQDLITKLNDTRNNIDRSEYNNFVVSKYINTCRCCGMDIQRLEKKYALMNFPFGDKFTDEETLLIFDLMNSEENKKTKKLTNEFLTKLHLPLCKSSNGLKSNENFRIIKLFEKALSAKSDVKFIFRDGKTYSCSPKDILVDKGRICFSVFSNDGIKHIYPDNIADIKLSDSRIRKIKTHSGEVIFELRGKLAKRYQLRENEQIVRIDSDGTMVISNKYEEKNELFRRLMRYDYLCKLLRPKSYVEEFKQLIDDTLKNYGITYESNSN